MDSIQLTRKKLADYILNRASNSLLAQFETLIDSEQHDVARTLDGASLSKTEYLKEVEKGKAAISQGRFKTTEELRELVSTWKK